MLPTDTPSRYVVFVCWLGGLWGCSAGRSDEQGRSQAGLEISSVKAAVGLSFGLLVLSFAKGPAKVVSSVPLAATDLFALLIFFSPPSPPLFNPPHCPRRLPFPTYQCSALRKGGHVVIKGRPCKIIDMSTSKTGKHGHAKVHLIATDVRTSFIPVERVFLASAVQKTDPYASLLPPCLSTDLHPEEA